MFSPPLNNGKIPGNKQGKQLSMRGGGLGSSTIFKNLMSPTPRRKWYYNKQGKQLSVRPEERWGAGVEYHFQEM